MKTPTDPRDVIASRVALEIQRGTVAILGIGIPSLVANHIPAEFDVILQSDNGILGLGPTAPVGEGNPHIGNAGGADVTVLPGGVFFDSCESFAMIRGGHLHMGVLGAFEVDSAGRMASYSIPGQRVQGMGGAMDILGGARRIVVAMLHCSVDKTTGRKKSKIVKKCSIPLTGTRAVDMIVTDMAVIRPQKGELLLTEIHPDYTIDDVLDATDAQLSLSLDIQPMRGFERH